MNLHDQLAVNLDEHASTHPLDVDRLTTAARAQGTRRRRRRTTGLGLAGSLAAAAVVGLLGATLGGVGLGGQETPVATDPVGPTGPSGAPVAATPRGVAAALDWAVYAQSQGSAAGFAAQGGDASVTNDLYGELQWDAADGQGLSVVAVNVQFSRGMFSRCGDDSQSGCRESTLPDGSRLTTYTETTPVTGGPGVTRVADLFRADGVRVAVTATNGLDQGATWDVTRPAPPLTIAQLTNVAEQPFWGHTLPQGFVDAGAGLAPFVDIDARSAERWSTP